MQKTAFSGRPARGSIRHLTKMLVVMKLMTFFLTAAFLNVSAKGLSQTLSLSGNNMPLEKVLIEIKKQTGFSIIYTNNTLAGAKPVTINKKNTPLVIFLEEVFTGQPITFIIESKTIILSRKQAGADSTQNKSNSFLDLLNHNSLPPPITIRGRVLNEKGEPVVASVIIKGTKKGTTTNTAGEFELTDVDEKAVLLISGISIETKEYRLSNNKKNETSTERVWSITISVITRIGVGDEVVITTGIFNKPKQNYTGAVSTISEKELKMFRGQNLIATLKNIDPAINVLSDNSLGSNPNRLPDISIRGNSSLPMSVTELNEGAASQLNTPLIIMDGFEIPLQKLMDFNDEEIRSITILKDASATAIYGSRGANGVIVITTKPPRAGKLRTTAQIGFNVEVPDLSSYNLLNAAEKLQLENTVGLYNNFDPEKDRALKKQYNQKLSDVLSGVNTDWLHQAVRTAITQRYNLRLEGGGDAFRWGTSVSYNSVGGAMKGSERNTFSGTVTLSYSLKNIIFRNQTSIDFTKGVESKYGSFSTYARMNPYWKINDDNGNPIKSFLQIGTTANPIGNPLYDARLNSINESRYNTIINNFSFEWNIVNNLRLRSQFGISRMNTSSDNFIPPDHSYFESTAYQGDDNFFRKGKYTKGIGDNTNINANLTLSYSKTFNKKHQVYIGLDNSIRETNGSSLSIITEGFPDDRLTNVTNGLQYAEGSKPSGNQSVTRSIGLTSNANYTYDNRYIVDMSFRADGSSQFGKNNRFAPFWSLGAGWNLHNESFLKNQHLISNLRLRGSYGETGSQQFPAYQALSTFSYYTDKRYMIWNGASLMGLGNEDLKWQVTKQIDLGAEFGLLNNRIAGSFDVYKKTTSNLLSQMDIPLANGFNSYTANIGEVQNTGFEAMLGGYLIRNIKRNILWTVTGKIAYNKNEITKLSKALKDQTEKAKTENIDINRLLYEGNSPNSIYAVPSLGIDPSSGQELFLDAQGNVTTTWNPAAKKYYGTTDPAYRGNVSTMFTYGNFTLNLSFGYRWGGQQYNQTLISKVEVTTAQLQYNVDKRVYNDRWQKTGDIKKYRGFNGAATRLTSRFVMDDNAFEFQTASLQYRWDSKYLKEKLKMDAINFSVNMSDIFYISSIKRERGTDYPFARRANLNISLMF